MKPYKIFKKLDNPFHQKIKIISELKEPNIPLRFFKCTCSPKKTEFVWEFSGPPDKIYLKDIDVPSVIY